MERRTFLAGVSAAAIATSGCLSTTRTGGSASPTATAGGDVDDVATHELVEAQFVWWIRTDGIRYIDETTETLEILEPENGAWVQASIELRNLGSRPVDWDDVANFQLHDASGGGVYAPVDGLPVDWEDVRPRESSVMKLIPSWNVSDRDLEPGKHRGYTPLFDVPPTIDPVLRWIPAEELLKSGKYW